MEERFQEEYPITLLSYFSGRSTFFSSARDYVGKKGLVKVEIY
jgi:hypothetical protein